MVQTPSPEDDTAARREIVGQLSLYDLDPLGQWVIHRLSMGDDLLICTDGSWVLRDPEYTRDLLDTRRRLDT